MFKLQKKKVPEQAMLVKGKRVPVKNVQKPKIIKTTFQEKSKQKSEPANLQKTAQETDNEILAKIQDVKFLKLFDMDNSFGPCLGLTRQERVNRARKYSIGHEKTLSKVEHIIDQHENDPDYRECLWFNILK